MRKVFIAMPAFGRINCTETTMSLMALARALHANGIQYYFSTQSFPDIGELRNMLLTLWYDRIPDATHFLQVDADMGFPPELVLDMLDFDEPLTACMYPKKTHPISFVGRGMPGTPVVRDGFIELEGAGAGVMLIRRDCIDTMIEKGAVVSDERLATHTAGEMLNQWGVKRIIRAFDQIVIVFGRLSEDLSFCRRHRECGGRVWANIVHRITHVGPYGFSGAFLDQCASPIADDRPAA